MDAATSARVTHPALQQCADRCGEGCESFAGHLTIAALAFQQAAKRGQEKKRTLIMRNLVTLVMTLALGCGLTACGQGQEAKPADKADVAKTAPSAASLRAEMHRTMAALIEARAAERPDQEKIQKLTEQVQSLRSQLQAKWPGAGAGGPGGWRCPWGGPGMGIGPAWGGGPGRGPGRGGPGPGRGPGAGWGAGRGAGWGAGRGAGFGGAFIDEDKDGVCDNYERLWGEKK